MAKSFPTLKPRRAAINALQKGHILSAFEEDIHEVTGYPYLFASCLICGAIAFVVIMDHRQKNLGSSQKRTCESVQRTQEVRRMKRMIPILEEIHTSVM